MLLRKSAERITAYLLGEKASEMLTPREDKILEALSWFIQDNFSDGEYCLHVSQFKDIPAARAYGKNNLLVASNAENMIKNVDRIEYIKIGDNKLYKTSRFLFYMEKYSGDTDIKELQNMSVSEMLRRISEGEEKLREKEYEEAKCR